MAGKIKQKSELSAAEKVIIELDKYSRDYNLEFDDVVRVYEDSMVTSLKSAFKVPKKIDAALFLKCRLNVTGKTLELAKLMKVVAEPYDAARQVELRVAKYYDKGAMVGDTVRVPEDPENYDLPEFYINPNPDDEEAAAELESFLEDFEPMSEEDSFHPFADKTVIAEIPNKDFSITLDEARGLVGKDKVSVGSVIEIAIHENEYSNAQFAHKFGNILTQNLRDLRKRYMNDNAGEVREGTVFRCDETNGIYIIDIDGVHLPLSFANCLKNDVFAPEDKIFVYSKSGQPDERGNVKPELTRLDKDFVRKLFEKYVPEVKDGTVIVERVARDPGKRSKVAVSSRDERVDPIGTCVGVNGTRVESIKAALGGHETVDIIPFAADAADYVRNALYPADNIEEITLLEAPGKKPSFLVKVPESEMTRVIGKEGINARLAAELTGYSIDIKSTDSPTPEEED